MAKLSTEKRREKLAQYIISEGQAKVGVLAEYFGVTTETIRKDLISLEEDGIIKKSHGKAVVSSGFIERPYEQRLSEYQQEKMRIAKTAVEYIPKNGVVIIDSGSTTYEIAKLLSVMNGLTIFTNNISAVPLLAQSNNELYSFGGKVRAESMAYIGDWALNAVKSVEADVAFLGTDGFSGRQGPCSSSFEEISIKKAIIEKSKKNILVADHSKFERSVMFIYAEWSDFDIFITDGSAQESAIKGMKKFVEVIVSKN